jgi:hypothetical protein
LRARDDLRMDLIDRGARTIGRGGERAALRDRFLRGSA